jgi:hypothetical protein
MEDVGRKKRKRRTTRGNNRVLRDAEQRAEADAEGANIGLVGVAGCKDVKEYECQNVD